ncbi:alpha/beta hydrolase [Streptomyces sp. NPDC058914]|uniref:alpha/beta hydrolase n=1 Tax=Streptomyces TaxID=1883 RepID=UPI0036A89BFE
MTAARNTDRAPDSERISRRRLRGRVALLGACGLLLTAPSAAWPDTPAVTRPAGADGTATDAAVPPELRRYHQQKLLWEPCPDTPSFQCATLKVPLDYAHPDAGDLVLTATRKKATGAGARIGSLLVNPGGPGGSAIDYLAGGGADLFSPSVRASYDLVAMDPRGVQYSTPVDCGLNTATTSSGVGRHMSADPAKIAAYEEVFEQFTDACARHAGRLLPHVGTLDAARDMDVLRALLGDDRLHYLGFSYGGYLGATYADLFPSRVGRMVLDGAIDPAIDGYQVVLQNAAGYQVAWESFAADCAARTDCPLGRSVKEISRGLDTLRRSLDRVPLRQGKDITITGESLLTAVTIGLKAPEWALLRAALQGLQAGDTTALQQLLGSAEDTSSNATEAHYAISCLSSPLAPRFTSAEVRAALRQLLNASPQFGEFHAPRLMQCAHWPVPPAQPAHPVSAPGAAPVLVVGTTRDPATPYAWSKALARQLASSRLLTYDGDGHLAYQTGSACVDTAVDRYLTLGRLPHVGTICPGTSPAAPVTAVPRQEPDGVRGTSTNP